MHEGSVSAMLGISGIPSISESTMIARDAAIAGYEGGRIHVQHVSCVESVEAIAVAKERGVQITGEASPHHLVLTDDEIRGASPGQERPDADPPSQRCGRDARTGTPLDTRMKMNPPLRSERDRQAIVDGLRDGTLDCVATDHAPHARDEKVPFEQAPMGTTGLETAFAALHTELSCPACSASDSSSSG